MKSSNLAWRIEPAEVPIGASMGAQAAQPAVAAPRADTSPHIRPRPRFDRRTIEIRDQGFALFRIR